MADVILVVHFVWVLCVIIPVPLIFLGWLMNWNWIRNFRFRTIHLGMMVFVALESVLGMICPLTALEEALRKDSGSGRYTDSFVSFWVRKLLYYDFEPIAFTIAYLAFAALIAALYFWIPPRRSSSS